MNSSEPMNSPQSSPAKTPALEWVSQPDKIGRLLEDVELKLVKKRRRRARNGRAALALLILAAVGMWAVPYARETGEATTVAAQRQSVALQDGSVAELNARTDLKTDFRYGRRTVRMEKGEAFFSVFKDPAHPFLVETPGGVVRVTGTKFNVRLNSAGKPEVTLLEGAVGLEGNAIPAVSLVPGQQFDPVHDRVLVLSAAELAKVTAWREGRLVLDGLTLGEAAARISAYQGKDISVAPGVASLQMGGSCSLDDLDGFLDFLPRALSVRVVPMGDGSFRIIAR